MAAKIIDGKKISAAAREEIRERAAKLTGETGVVPGLAVIIVGEDPASKVYVRNKKKACEEAGFYSVVTEMPADTTQEELLEKIAEFRADKRIHGILVQLPLPEGIDEQAVIAAIPPEKDVDAFHPENVGHIMIGDYRFLPCTPAGVMKMLEAEGIEVSGKRCVVIGRSNIVGKPMAMLLMHADGTVTVCHRKTRDTEAIAREADILVSAVGRAGFLTADMVKPGAVVIDVGMNRNAEGRLCGDADFEAVSEVASAITPVPGGVGVMTITMLLENTLRAAEAAAGARLTETCAISPRTGCFKRQSFPFTPSGSRNSRLTLKFPYDIMLNAAWCRVEKNRLPVYPPSEFTKKVRCCFDVCDYRNGRKAVQSQRRRRHLR